MPSALCLSPDHARWGGLLCVLLPAAPACARLQHRDLEQLPYLRVHKQLRHPGGAGDVVHRAGAATRAGECCGVMLNWGGCAEGSQGTTQACRSCGQCGARVLLGWLGVGWQNPSLPSWQAKSNGRSKAQPKHAMRFPEELTHGMRAREEHKLICIYIHSPCIFLVSQGLCWWGEGAWGDLSSHPEQPSSATHWPKRHALPAPCRVPGVGGMSFGAAMAAWGLQALPTGTLALAGRAEQLCTEQPHPGSLPAKQGRDWARATRGDPVLAQPGAGEQSSAVGTSDAGHSQALGMWGIPNIVFPPELGKTRFIPPCIRIRMFLCIQGRGGWSFPREQRLFPSLTSSIPFSPGCLQRNLCLLGAWSW